MWYSLFHAEDVSLPGDKTLYSFFEYYFCHSTSLFFIGLHSSYVTQYFIVTNKGAKFLKTESRSVLVLVELKPFK